MPRKNKNPDQTPLPMALPAGEIERFPIKHKTCGHTSYPPAYAREVRGFFCALCQTYHPREDFEIT